MATAKQSEAASVRSGPQLASSAAFDLVASSEGALLSWARGACGQGVTLQRYDADGEPVSRPITLDGCGPVRDASAEIVQLGAVADGGKLALAWVARADAQAQLLGSFGSDTGSAFAPTTSLGPAAAEALPGRSRLSLAAAESGPIRVAWRAPQGACTSGAGQCARVLFSPQPPARAPADRGADVREIPEPCPELLVGTLWSRGIWYDAFCAITGAPAQPVTEVYAIRPEIFYAEAFPVLAGCVPLGIAPAPTGVLVLGMCDAELHVQRLSEARKDVIAGAMRQVRCESGRPTLVIHNRQGEAIRYRLASPKDRLELWLPHDVAPPASRVAFTGRKLLVASVNGRQLQLQAWKCQGETLVSDRRLML